MPGSPATRKRRPRPDHAFARAASSAALSASRPTKGSRTTAGDSASAGQRRHEVHAPARSAATAGVAGNASRSPHRGVDLHPSGGSGAGDATVRTDDAEGLLELDTLDRPTEQIAELAARRRAVRQGHEHRQCVDALEEVVAGRLAELGLARGEVEDVVDDLERGAESQAVGRRRVDERRGRDRRPARRCGPTSRTALTSCLRPRRSSRARCGRPGTRVCSSRISPSQSRPIVAARRPATSVPRLAAISDAFASRKSPARIALRFPQRAFTLSTVRRVTASSITSSWYSDPRCTSSTEVPPMITSSDGRGRVC